METPVTACSEVRQYESVTPAAAAAAAAAKRSRKYESLWEKKCKSVVYIMYEGYDVWM